MRKYQRKHRGDIAYENDGDNNKTIDKLMRICDQDFDLKVGLFSRYSLNEKFGTGFRNYKYPR